MHTQEHISDVARSVAYSCTLLQVLGGSQQCPWCASRLYSHDIADYAVSMDALELMMTPQPPSPLDAVQVEEKLLAAANIHASPEEGAVSASVRIPT